MAFAAVLLEDDFVGNFFQSFGIIHCATLIKLEYDDKSLFAMSNNFWHDFVEFTRQSYRGGFCPK